MRAMLLIITTHLIAASPATGTATEVLLIVHDLILASTRSSRPPKPAIDYVLAMCTFMATHVQLFRNLTSARSITVAFK